MSAKDQGRHRHAIAGRGSFAGFRLAALTLWITPVALAAPSANLTDSYRASLRQSEIVADKSELIDQAQEHHKQAWGSMLPTVSSGGTVFRQAGGGSTGTASNSSSNYESTVKLTLAQPLFRGFRDFAALRQTKESVSAQVEARRQAMVQLYNDVAQNFYSVLAAERDLVDLSTETDLYEKRINELKERTKIGQSRVNDVLSTESGLAGLQVQVKQVRGQLDAAREVFVFLTGLDRQTELLDEPPSLPTISTTPLEPLNAYLSRLPERPDVRATEYQHRAAEENVSMAKRAHLPAADFSANYYLLRGGTDKDVDWDVLLGLTFPLFEGGVTQSKVRGAISQNRQAELALERTKRQAETEIRTLYQAVGWDREQLQALDRVRKISERTYDAQVRDYRLGLVTNLDVLQALTAYRESIRALDRAYYAAKIDLARLEAAAARTPLSKD
jgi:outer membrane protein